MLFAIQLKPPVSNTPTEPHTALWSLKSSGNQAYVITTSQSPVLQAIQNTVVDLGIFFFQQTNSGHNQII